MRSLPVPTMRSSVANWRRAWVAGGARGSAIGRLKVRCGSVLRRGKLPPVSAVASQGRLPGTRERHERKRNQRGKDDIKSGNIVAACNFGQRLDGEGRKAAEQSYREVIRQRHASRTRLRREDCREHAGVRARYRNLEERRNNLRDEKARERWRRNNEPEQRERAKQPADQQWIEKPVGAEFIGEFARDRKQQEVDDPAYKCSEQGRLEREMQLVFHIQGQIRVPQIVGCRANDHHTHRT